MENFTNNNFEDLNSDSENIEFENNNTNPDNTGSFNNRRNSSINVFALFARSLGIFAIFCAIFGIFIGSFICGGVAIILAILSKGYESRMEKNAIIGLACGCIAIVIQISTFVFGVYNIINVPEYRELFNSMYEQMYGEPVDESITDMLDGLGASSPEGGLL
ncbi:MAG: DUF4190 domain-containing protein [Lachnospiraceae bacterium]|nr:DUF4190 domain-containing protein [Lachnospiraceae bacterium]